MNPEREERGRIPHVVIVGGGFGDLAAAKALKRTPARVTLIDCTNHHLFQPLIDRNGLEQVTVGSNPTQRLTFTAERSTRWQPNTNLASGNDKDNQ